MKIHLISFATTNWLNAIKRFNRNVKVIQDIFHYFDSAKIYTEKDLDSDYMNFFSAYTSDRGYAMWSWKPYLIMKKLQQIDDNDFLIYLDGGCNLHTDNLNNTFTYLNYLLLLLFKLNLFELKLGIGLNAKHPIWNKNVIVQITKQTLTKFNLLDNKEFLYEFPHFEAGCLIMCKDNTVMKLINDWYYFMCNNYTELFSNNFYDKTNQYPEFGHNGADQSVLQCLLYSQYNNKYLNIGNFWYDMNIYTRIKG